MQKIRHMQTPIVVDCAVECRLRRRYGFGLRLPARAKGLRRLRLKKLETGILKTALVQIRDVLHAVFISKNKILRFKFGLTEKKSMQNSGKKTQKFCKKYHEHSVAQRVFEGLEIVLPGLMKANQVLMPNP